MMGWLRRLSRRNAPAPAPAPEATASGRPAAGRGGAVVVTVLDLTGDSLERVLEMTEQRCAANGTRPVFVTESMDLLPFRRRRLAVEQVVNPEARAVAAPDLPWQLYRERQLALIRERWQPVAVVSFGRKPGPGLLTVRAG
ncbi:hypothetical protein SH611_14020 [Geminicoccaceae bacterium 1502E]|nr:hypothetical protein [Geminicoccaceae bacterium 1502E]